MDLYRFFDASGNLLYVGISLHAAQRASQHRGDKAWWNDVNRMDVEKLTATNRADAEAVERRVIEKEKPHHNVMWNGARQVASTPRPPTSFMWHCSTCCEDAVGGFLAINGWMNAWSVTCPECDIAANTAGTHHRNGYSIGLDKISTLAEVTEWTDHLLGKTWFEICTWLDRIRNSCQLDKVDEAVEAAELAFLVREERRRRRASRHRGAT